MSVADAIDIKWSRYIPHVPTPKQHAFLWLDVKEAFFGGAAGGGKSDALLMAALQYVDVPNYAAIIFRKSYTDLQLPGAIMDRAQMWLMGHDAKWNDNDKEFTFPSGATITFGYLDKPKDKFRYRSAEFQFIGFDELTDFREDDYTFLASRLRRPSGIDNDDPLSRVPLRLRSASNPGGPGHHWVKERFIDGRTENRVFIPSALDDNPHLDQQAYEESLSLLDEVTHAQLRHGDWSVRPPGYWMFNSEHIAACVELGHEYDRKLARGVLLPTENYVTSSVDFGDYRTVQLPIVGLANDGMYFSPTEVICSREDLEVISERFKKSMEAYDWWWKEVRYDASFKQSARTVGSLLTKEMGPHNPISKSGRPNMLPCSFGDYKSLGIKYLRLLMARTFRMVNNQPWLDGKPVTDRFMVISPQNKQLAIQLEKSTGKEIDPEKMEKQPGDDDVTDAAIAGAIPLARKHRKLILEMQEHLKAPQPYTTDEDDLTEDQRA